MDVLTQVKNTLEKLEKREQELDVRSHALSIMEDSLKQEEKRLLALKEKVEKTVDEAHRELAKVTKHHDVEDKEVSLQTKERELNREEVSLKRWENDLVEIENQQQEERSRLMEWDQRLAKEQAEYKETIKKAFFEELANKVK
jgi:hypothetical protein